MDEEITPDELHELLADGADVEVVDIRPEPHFRRGHIPTSRNVPFARLPQRVEELDGAETVVTVCPHGKSSIQAARLVRSYEGVPDDARIASLAGGLDEWEYGLETDGEDKRERSPF